MHAVLVQSTIGAGVITGFDIDQARGMAGVLVILTPDNAPKLSMHGGAQQTVRAPTVSGARAVVHSGPQQRVAEPDRVSGKLQHAGPCRLGCGRVWVDSQSGAGTTFFVELPELR